MTVDSLAITWMRIVAEHLGDLRDEVVFVGGATVGLLTTDPAASAARATKDVDVIVSVASWGEYAPLQERLRKKGFSEDTSEGAPLCRWLVAGITVDIMPTTDDILGFSNRWYAPAMETAQRVQISDAIPINVIIDELKTMYRAEPEQLWPISKLAERLGVSMTDVARATTFLSGNPLFRAINWDTSSGFVESFSLGDLVLDAEHLVIQ